jgi:hypothetical protein
MMIGFLGLARETVRMFVAGQWRTGLSVILLLLGGVGFWVLIARDELLAGMACIVGSCIASAPLMRAKGTERNAALTKLKP